MSKELFEQYQEEQIHTLVSMPYNAYKFLGHVTKASILEGKIEFIKHYIPSNRDKFKKDKRWSDLEKTIKESRAEQREIESEIRVNGNFSKA